MKTIFAHFLAALVLILPGGPCAAAPRATAQARRSAGTSTGSAEACR